MVQSTDLWQLDHAAQLGRLDRARNRCILRQSQVRAPVLVVVEIRSQNAAQATLVEDEDVVKTLTPDRTNQSLDIRILPRRARCGQNLLHVHRLGGFGKWFSVAGIAIPHEVQVCAAH